MLINWSRLSYHGRWVVVDGSHVALQHWVSLENSEKRRKDKKDNFFFNIKCDSAFKIMIWPGEIGFYDILKRTYVI